MSYQEFVARIIIEGEQAARRDYAGHAAKLEGALAGFAACLNCESPPELALLLTFAREKAIEQVGEPIPDADEYVYAQHFEAEIEWVCNCVSALLLNEGYDPIITPTSRGVMKCAELLGAATMGRPREPQWFLDSPPAGTPDCLCSFCGHPIDAHDGLVMRAWNQQKLEIRSCTRDECTTRFLSGRYGEPAPGRAS